MAGTPPLHNVGVKKVVETLNIVTTPKGVSIQYAVDCSTYLNAICQVMFGHKFAHNPPSPIGLIFRLLTIPVLVLETVFYAVQGLSLIF